MQFFGLKQASERMRIKKKAAKNEPQTKHVTEWNAKKMKMRKKAFRRNMERYEKCERKINCENKYEMNSEICDGIFELGSSFHGTKHNTIDWLIFVVLRSISNRKESPSTITNRKMLVIVCENDAYIMPLTTTTKTTTREKKKSIHTTLITKSRFLLYTRFPLSLLICSIFFPLKQSHAWANV